MLSLLSLVLLGSTPVPMPASLIDTALRSQSVVVAEASRFDKSRCVVYFLPTQALRGQLPTGEVEVTDCGRRRGDHKRADDLSRYQMGELDVLFVFLKDGRFVARSFRYDYWNESLPWSFEVRRMHVERILDAARRSDKDPSDATDVVAMLDSDDEMLVRLGLSFARKDFGGDKRMPHKELARTLLRIATQKSWPEGGDLSSELAFTISKYAKGKLDLDESTRTALESEGNRREQANRDIREAKRRAARR